MRRILLMLPVLALVACQADLPTEVDEIQLSVVALPAITFDAMSETVLEFSIPTEEQKLVRAQLTVQFEVQDEARIKKLATMRLRKMHDFPVGDADHYYVTTDQVPIRRMVKVHFQLQEGPGDLCGAEAEYDADAQVAAVFEEPTKLVVRRRVKVICSSS